MFFLLVSQACRGDQHDVPVTPLDVVDHGTDKLDANVTQVDAASVYTLPAGADFLMCYSVAEGAWVFVTGLLQCLGVSPWLALGQVFLLGCGDLVLHLTVLAWISLITWHRVTDESVKYLMEKSFPGTKESYKSNYTEC